MVALSWGYTVFNCFLRFCKGVIKWIRCDIILPKTKGKNMSLAFQEGAHSIPAARGGCGETVTI